MVVLLALVAFLVPTYAGKPTTEAREIVSGYVATSYTEPTAVIWTVSDGKTFVLTDILGVRHLDNRNASRFSIKENDTVKLVVEFDWDSTVSDGNPQSIHFNSGIPFSAGSAVTISNNEAAPVAVVISGYEI